MQASFRLHGHSPYSVVAIHGGPGAIGEARPFAEALSEEYGVIEPFLLSKTLEGQIADLVHVIKEHSSIPVILIGHSYGAMISYIVTARYPELIKKLIMISSGLLEAKDAAIIDHIRNSRLSPEERTQLENIRSTYKQASGEAKKQAFLELIRLIQQADAYNPLSHQSDLEVIRPELYDTAWEGMKKLRDSGELAAYGENIHCPIIAIHGDYDPRPAESVRHSLETYVKDYSFTELEHCGHYPWYEQEARDRFYRVLREAIVS